MSWSVSHSWQSPSIISTICSVGEDLLVAYGLEVELLDSEGRTRWRKSLPFKIHAATYDSGKIGILCGHGFHILNASDGKQLGEGRSTDGGFSDIMKRPGGGWILSCREGYLHIFNGEGRGLKRLDSGGVRRLVGWFDREHLLWQDQDGKLRCARLANNDSQRLLEDRIWSWVSRMSGGRILLQSADGMLWEGTPHPYGWDGIETVDTRSLEPLAAHRAGDGWWVLSIEGELHNMSNVNDQDGDVANSNLGDMLIGLAADKIVTAKRDGLVRFWQSPELANLRRVEIQMKVAEVQMASDWEERRRIFQRACVAEDEGRISLAIELYESLGRSSDVNRLLAKQRGD
ncbi:MAG: hypothetical protein QGI21_00300 [Candidatus Poseidoniaceae archaeon]|nr:hypothetical protein [Candidatus Poseidoniaceae archaeon]